jgi:hypothetical protein
MPLTSSHLQQLGFHLQKDGSYAKIDVRARNAPAGRHGPPPYAKRPGAAPKLTTPKTIILYGYLTPSLNKLLHKHWSVVHRAKLEAQAALAKALVRSLG